MRAVLRLARRDGGRRLRARLIASARAAVGGGFPPPCCGAPRLPDDPAGLAGRRLIPLPLSPLGRSERVGLIESNGDVTPVAALVGLGPDPWDAPGLTIGRDRPSLDGRTILVEVIAGCGGDGPPVPEPLAQGVRLTVADGFENRGDGSEAGPPAAPCAHCRRPLRRLPAECGCNRPPRPKPSGRFLP